MMSNAGQDEYDEWYDNYLDTAEEGMIEGPGRELTNTPRDRFISRMSPSIDKNALMQKVGKVVNSPEFNSDTILKIVDAGDTITHPVGRYIQKEFDKLQYDLGRQYEDHPEEVAEKLLSMLKSRTQGVAEGSGSLDYDKVLNAIAALYGDDIWDNDAMQDLANDLEQAGPTDQELDFIIAKGKLPKRLSNTQFTNNDSVQFGEQGIADRLKDLDPKNPVNIPAYQRKAASGDSASAARNTKESANESMTDILKLSGLK
jgi:hypothetical protein